MWLKKVFFSPNHPKGGAKRIMEDIWMHLQKVKKLVSVFKTTAATL